MMIWTKPSIHQAKLYRYKYLRIKIFWYIRDIGTTKICVVYKYFFNEISAVNFFLYLLFAEKINFLLVNQQKCSQLKLVLRSWKKSKQNFVKKRYTKFWWFGCHEWVIWLFDYWSCSSKIWWAPFYYKCTNPVLTNFVHPYFTVWAVEKEKLLVKKTSQLWAAENKS